MTDIDFDELDRAVNSLMNGVKQAPIDNASQNNQQNDVARPTQPQVASSADDFNASMRREIAEMGGSSQGSRSTSSGDYSSRNAGSGVHVSTINRSRLTPSQRPAVVSPRSERLDQPLAVNRFSAPTISTSAPRVQTPGSTVNVDSQNSIVEIVNNSTDKVEPQDTVESNPVNNRPALAVRRSGRFMDVVHPSSDMTTRSAMKPGVSRNGNTISPVGDSSIKSSTSSVKETVDLNVKEQTAEIKSEAIDAQAKSDNLVSLNLDQSNYIPKDEIKEQASTYQPNYDLVEDKTSDILSQTPDIVAIPNDIHEILSDKLENENGQKLDAVSKQSEVQSMESPFLSGAKIEKRPLGAVSSGDSNENSSTSAASSAVSYAESDDVLAVESEKSFVNNKESNLSNTSIITDTVAPARFTQNSNIKSNGDAFNSQPATQSPASSQVNGDIFNADGYSQPLAHPAKKKSGWMIVILILMAAALGVGIALAFYLLT